MAALSGLCSLRHFDLDLICAYQVPAGNAETAGCHLLYGRASVHAVRSYCQSVIILAAFSGVGTSVKSVHGNRKGFMRFLGNGAVGHCSRFKSGHNGFNAFHLFNGHSLFRVLEIHQATQIFNGLLVIYQSCVLLEQFIIPSSGCLLKQMDGSRIIKMLICTASHLVMAQAV